MWGLSSSGKITPDTIKEFNAQSPRTTAIVGGAILEDVLQNIVATRFPVEGDTKKELFSAVRGPLGNLDAKLKVAYAMGIISKAAFKDMATIQSVRNNFAHRLEVVDFEHSLVCQPCMGLSLIDKHIFPRGTPEEETPKGLSTKIWLEDYDDYMRKPRGRYFVSVMLFHHAITARTPHPENPKPPLPRALI